MNYIELFIAAMLVFIILFMIYMLLTFKKNARSHSSDNASSLNDSAISALSELGKLLSQNQKNASDAQNTRLDRMNSDIRDFQRNVSEQLSKVYGKFGEIRAVADGMNDLRRILSNVKTRGILGEIQLGSILDEILAPEQFDTDVATVPHSRNRVEFAIRLPQDEEGFIYLPIDSKFPLDAYYSLQDSCDSKNPADTANARKLLMQRIKLFAKDIHTKYVEPPYTTDFAIMFLPLEGLYAEVVNSGMVEILQKEYKVNVAGPSTMAAILNSLQMGFKTLALEKRSVEAWEFLSGIKSEFEKFSACLENTQKHISRAEAELENLAGVRTRAILKKLNDIEKTNEN